MFNQGGLAGAPAASLVTPADVIKTRLQTKLPSGLYMYNSIGEATKDIVANEGVQGMFCCCCCVFFFFPRFHLRFIFI